MAAQQDIERILQAGIAAARSGDRTRARQLLEAVLRRDENNEKAWIWLASVVTTTEERRFCLERVLQINPGNARARAALQRLNGGDNARTTQGRSGFMNILIGIIAIGGLALLILGIAFVLFPGDQSSLQIPTNTPAPIAQLPAESPTPLPTSTFPGVLATTRTAPTLPPTFTPTYTATPSETPPPSPTPFSVADFTILMSVRPEGSAETELYRLRGDGSDLSSLIPDARDAVYSSDGQQIAFIRDVTYPATEETEETTAGEIFVAPVDNPGAAEQVTRLQTASAYQPDFAPSGRQIVFVSDFDGDDEIWLLDMNTGITSQLTDNNLSDRDPAWSPDGNRIVYATDAQSPGFMELFILVFDEDGEISQERLTNDPGSSYQPAWSPDGERLVYVNDRSGSGDLYLIDANGQRGRILRSIADADARRPHWSPNGEWIGFIANLESENFQLYLSDLAGRELVRVTEDSRDVQQFSFRPDLIFRIRSDD